MTDRRTLRLANVLKVALLLSIGFLGACSPKSASHAPKSYTGETLVVARQMINDTKPVAAIMTTRDMGEATARVSGLLVSLNVREGDFVTRGQVIAYVKDDSINAQASAYSAMSAAALAEATRARATYKRTQGLFDKGIYAQARLDQDRANVDIAEANLLAAKAQGVAGSAMVNNGAILAPTSGRVIHADTPQGSVVMAGQSVATITAGPRLVRVDFPEGQSSSLRSGDSLMVEANNIRVNAIIEQIYPSVTSGQITMDVSANGLDNIKIGEHVTAYVNMGQRHAIIIPKRFVTTRYGLDYVSLIQDGNSLLQTNIQTTTLPDARYVEVISGLNDGDRLAINTPNSSKVKP